MRTAVLSRPPRAEDGMTSCMVRAGILYCGAKRCRIPDITNANPSAEFVSFHKSSPTATESDGDQPPKTAKSETPAEQLAAVYKLSGIRWLTTFWSGEEIDANIFRRACS
jgi:hypothetical protein